MVFPEELDLQIRNPGNLLKNRGGKRGRPKKSTIRPSLLPPKPPPIPDEEQEELKVDFIYFFKFLNYFHNLNILILFSG